jgi:hypothetical protein
LEAALKTRLFFAFRPLKRRLSQLERRSLGRKTRFAVT